jgi:hypothetical protein
MIWLCLTCEQACAGACGVKDPRRSIQYHYMHTMMAGVSLQLTTNILLSLS